MEQFNLRWIIRNIRSIERLANGSWIKVDAKYPGLYRWLRNLEQEAHDLADALDEEVDNATQ